MAPITHKHYPQPDVADLLRPGIMYVSVNS